MTHQVLIMWLRYYRMEWQQVIARNAEGWEGMSRFVVFLVDFWVWSGERDWFLRTDGILFLSLFLGRETCITETTAEGFL